MCMDCLPNRLRCRYNIPRGTCQERIPDNAAPHGGKMLYRLPTVVFIDGKPVKFEHYGLKTDSPASVSNTVISANSQTIS